MDGCSSSSWLLLHGHGGSIDSGRTYGSADGLHDKQDGAISVYMEQQLKQIHMLMGTEEEGYADAVPTQSSSTFPSFSGSPGEISSLGPAAESTPGHKLAAEVIYEDDNVGTIVDLDDLLAEEEGHHQEQPQQLKHGGRHESRGAFRPYVRHLSPRKMPKPGTCGQRAIKVAMSALERMHMARVAQWQSYSYQVAPPPSVGAGGSSYNYNQLQKVLSERKRREKLNDSFKALRAVLPLGSKKDKASTLIRARDYVNALMARVSELEEKNRMLAGSQLHDGGEQGGYSHEQVEVDANRPAAEKTPPQYPQDSCRRFRAERHGCCCFHTSVCQRGWHCKIDGHGTASNSSLSSDSRHI